MATTIQNRSLVVMGIVATAVVIGSCVCFQTKTSGLSIQTATEVPVQITTGVLAPSQMVAPPVVSEPELEPLASSTVEEHLEDIGTVVNTVSKAALPIFAALMAVVAGFFFRNLSAKQQPAGLKPMEMAAEDTPLTRRGALTALAAFPVMAAGPAFAAKTGGRIGGGSGFRSFSSRAAPPPPPVTGGAAVGGVTGGGAVIVTPPPPVILGPPVVASPFGFGPSISYGFSTGELLALSALELGDAFLREQRRQEYIRQQLEVQRKLGQDEAQIEALQKQLAQQEQVMRELQDAMRTKGVTAPAQ